MLTKHDIYSKIDHDLDGPVRDLCRVIVEFLTSNPAKPLKHITYVTLVNGSKLSAHNEEEKIKLLRVTDYLSSNRLHLLDMHFQFIESDDSDPVPIDDADLSKALYTGEFYHPESGQLIEDFNHYLFPYFTPTNFLESLHG
ncbi:hypothetical protein D0N50_10090 [Erwinia billingiae]|uniref:hypothetical protein n=1 Tax=Erwinia billingiae TaxID=182337 RepID=UPI001245B5D1|nr:hypothetical protein [Erwinia billingiae]QEW32003.1 hypothetical protein D0N50_10090 [Erwinia billingiae]